MQSCVFCLCEVSVFLKQKINIVISDMMSGTEYPILHIHKQKGNSIMRHSLWLVETAAFSHFSQTSPHTQWSAGGGTRCQKIHSKVQQLTFFFLCLCVDPDFNFVGCEYFDYRILRKSFECVIFRVLLM